GSGPSGLTTRKDSARLSLRRSSEVKTTDRKGPTVMKRSTSLFAAAFALLAGAGAARADLIAWTYNWDRSPVSVASDSGNGSVSFTNEPTKHATGSSDTVATNLKANSLAPATAPDTISGAKGAYTLTLKLTDKDSGQSGTLTFTGKLSG